MPRLSGTEFVSTFINFGQNGFSTEGLNYGRYKIAIDKENQERNNASMTATLFSLMTNNHSYEYEVEISDRIKLLFYEKVYMRGKTDINLFSLMEEISERLPKQVTLSRCR